MHASEAEFGERLRLAAMRERELHEQLVAASREATDKERQLQEKLALCHDELSVLRLQAASASTAASAANTAATAASADSAPSPVRARQMLQSEVDSLHCVLQLKQNDIAKLRKQNHELAADAAALPAITVKAQSLQTRIEDLQLQLEQKCADELELRQKLRHAEKCFAHETSNRRNVSLDNEQLRWKLMQNSEKFSSTLSELSKHYPKHSDCLAKAQQALDNQSTSDLSGASFGARNSFGGGGGTGSASFLSSTHTATDLSPPSTPVVKGVVEKSESVSWVLEINDGESAEALASRIVRRAGSFRSHLGDRSSLHQQQTPAKKRHAGQTNGSAGGQPLAQSASAASILRHFSTGEPSGTPSPHFRRHPMHTAPVADAATIAGVGRMRSKSVSTASSTAAPKACDKWMGQPMCSSSPLRVKRSPRPAPTAAAAESVEPAGAESSPKTSRPRSNSQTAVESSSSSAFVRRNTTVNGGSFRGTRGGCTAKMMSLQQPTPPPAAPQAPSASLPASSSSSASAPSAPPAGCSAGAARSDLLQSAAAASMQDSPKFQQIKESAGEAMVSGTNSEDDDDCDDDDDDDDNVDNDNDDDDDDDDVDLLLDAGSSGSSDESMSVSSGRTTNSSHSHFDRPSGRSEPTKLRRVSLEDVTMHDIVESLARSQDDNF